MDEQEFEKVIDSIKSLLVTFAQQTSNETSNNETSNDEISNSNKEAEEGVTTEPLFGKMVDVLTSLKDNVPDANNSSTLAQIIDNMIGVFNNEESMTIDNLVNVFKDVDESIGDNVHKLGDYVSINAQKSGMEILTDETAIKHCMDMVGKILNKSETIDEHLNYDEFVMLLFAYRTNKSIYPQNMCILKAMDSVGDLDEGLLSIEVMYDIYKNIVVVGLDNYYEPIAEEQDQNQDDEHDEENFKVSI